MPDGVRAVFLLEGLDMIAFVQIAEVFYFNSGTNTLTLSSTQPRTAGNRNVVLVNWYQPNQSASLGVTSVSDTDGNTYTPLGASIFDASLYFGVGAYECRSIKPGAGTNTITIFVDGNNFGNFNGAACVEYSGTNASAASYGYNEHGSTSGGTIGLSLTPATVGDVMVGWFGVTDATTTGNINTLRGTVQPSGGQPDSLWDEYTTTSLAAHSVGGSALTFGCVVGCVMPSGLSTYQPGPPGGPKVSVAAGGW
jgi:hypothetical protein